jgi:hypothetical protein
VFRVPCVSQQVYKGRRVCIGFFFVNLNRHCARPLTPTVFVVAIGWRYDRCANLRVANNQNAAALDGAGTSLNEKLAVFPTEREQSFQCSGELLLGFRLWKRPRPVHIPGPEWSS